MGLKKRGFQRKFSDRKVRYFNRALREDMLSKLVQKIRKKPPTLLLHVVTNTVSDSPKVILKKIKSLIPYTKANNPNCR